MATRPVLGLIYMLKALQQLGEDVAPVLERHGLSLDRIDPSARVDRVLELQIHTEIAECLRDPLAGLKSGKQYGFAGYGPLSMLLMTCANGLDAIQTGIRYYRLTYLYSALSFEPGPERSTLILSPPQLPQRAFRFRVDGEMSGTYKLLRDLQMAMGSEILQPVQVDMPYPRPPEADAYEAFFACPVRFGQTQARFVIRSADLQRPFQTCDPTAHALYRRQCDEQLQRVTNEPQALSARVMQQLALYQHRTPAAAQIARIFEMSERSFRRQLSAEGTSFRDLVAGVRFQRARQLLEQAGMSVEAVAEQLGYAEPAAFIHAFRRWSGTSPLAWRKAQGDANPKQR